MIIPSEKPSCGTPQIVIMGTGYGECILVHLGNEKYVMIDSFINPETKNPIAVDYLESIGLCTTNIIGIICTHWDDDHIRGMYKIASDLEGINIGIPATFSSRDLTKLREYLELAKGAQDHVPMDEFTNLLEMNSKEKIKFKYCLCQKQLFQKQIGAENLLGINVETLSPSEDQFREFLDQLVLPKEGDLMQSVNFSNNRISLVSIFDFNNRCCLFGGDLENDHGEWDKIIEDYHYPKSEVFKIPHHGSKTGYSQEVWMSIVDKPISIITRFNKGKNSLPSEDQVSAIKRESKKVFIIGGRNKPEKGLGTKILEGFKSQAPHLIVKRKEKLGIVKLTYNATGWSCEAIGEVEEI